MDGKLFNDWLRVFKKFSMTKSDLIISNCRIIEKYYGDLDMLYSSNRCTSLLEQFEYTKEDRELKNKPRHNIPIYGNIYGITKTYEITLKLYLEFKDNSDCELNQEIFPKWGNVDSVSENKDNDMIRNDSDNEETEEEIVNEAIEAEKLVPDGTFGEKSEKSDFDGVELFNFGEVNKNFEETLLFASTLREDIKKQLRLILDLQDSFLKVYRMAVEQQHTIGRINKKEIELNQTISNQQASITQMTEFHKDQLKNKDLEIDSRDHALTVKNQHLSDKDLLLAERDADLKKKSQELDIANQELINKDMLLAEREVQLSAVTNELESLKEEKISEKRSFIEFSKVKETMQNILKLLRGDNDSELVGKGEPSHQQSNAEKEEKEIS